jgi:hypothetical protein
MRLAYVSALLLGSALGACAQDPEVSSPYELEGRVIDDRTERGLEGAEVSFSSDTLDRAETHTDGDGHFQFTVEAREGVQFGTIRANHDDYADGAARSVYLDDTAHAITLRLRAEPKDD